MVKADQDYLTKALQKKGIDASNMSQQEKIDALTKKSGTPPKKTIKKLSNKEGKSKLISKEEFLQKHNKDVTGTIQEKRKKLDSMWNTYIGAAPTLVDDKYPEFDEKLDDKFATLKGLKYVGSANGKFFYRPIEKKVPEQSSDKKIKVDKQEDPLQKLLMHKNMKLPMLRSIAADVLNLPQSGNKDTLVTRITAGLKKADDAADEEKEEDDEEDDDADADEEDDEEDDEEEEEVGEDDDDDEEDDDEEDDDEEEDDEEEDDE